MDVCKHCDQEIPDEAKFCPFCRGQVGEAPRAGVKNSTQKNQQNQTSTSKGSNTFTAFNKKLFARIRTRVVSFWIWIWKHFWIWLTVLVIASSFFNNKSSNQSIPPPTYRPGTSSTSSYRPSAGISEDIVKEGEYSCSQYHHSQLDALRTSESEASYIEIAQQSMQKRLDEIESLEAEISAMNVTEYSSQYLLDEYNSKVNEYNTKLNSYQSDVSMLSNRIDRFNVNVNVYNNYLMTNCHK